MSSSRTTQLLRQAVALHQRGNLPQAEALYGEVLRNDPDNFDALHLLGVIARQGGAVDQAIQLIGQAIAIDSSKALAHCNLGAALHDAQRHEEALASYARALALQPRYPMALANRANVLRALGRYQEALEGYDAALALQAAYPEALCNRGVTLQALGRHDDALDSYGRALTMRPGHGASYCGAAVTLQSLGRFEEAREAYRNAIEAEPDDARAWTSYGTLLLRMNDSQGALDCHQHALQLQPGNVQAHMHRANALRTLGQEDDAIASYRDALACSAGLPGAPDLVAAIHYHLAALGAEAAPVTPPPRYVAALFDQYADGFDHHLQQVLQYRAPQLLMAALAARFSSRLSAPDASLDVIDLGCGTGLCGPLLRPWARTLAGVDLSPQMLQQARTRGGYDALACADIADYLHEHPDSASLLVAADVLVYLGDLQPVMRAARRALRAGGVWAFSVEALECGSVGSGEGESDYALQPSGRYAHGEGYLRVLAQAHGFSVDSVQLAVLRQDAERDVTGYIVVLSRA